MIAIKFYRFFSIFIFVQKATAEEIYVAKDEQI